MQNFIFFALFLGLNLFNAETPTTVLLQEESITLQTHERDAMFFSSCDYSRSNGILQIVSLFEVTKCEGIAADGTKLFSGMVDANLVKLNVRKFPNGTSKLLLYNDIDIEPFELNIIKK